MLFKTCPTCDCQVVGVSNSNPLEHGFHRESLEIGNLILFVNETLWCKKEYYSEELPTS